MPGTAAKPAKTETPDNVWTALLAFQAEAPRVNKGNTAVVKTTGGGEYRYTYADLADVVDAAQPILTRLGLVFTCQPRLTAAGGYELAGRIVHASSGTDVEGCLPLFGRDAQSIGSGITYARRYLLGCLTGLVTDDDVDARNAGQPAHAQSQPEAQAQSLPPHVAALRDDLTRLDPEVQTAVQAEWRKSTLPSLYHLTSTEQADQVRAMVSKVLADRNAQGSQDPT